MGERRLMNKRPEPEPFGRFLALVKRVIAVPKPEIEKREAEYRASKKEKPKFKRSG